MGTSRFTPEFKEEAVRQITECGYSVPKFSTVWAFLHTTSTSYRLPNPLTTSSSPVLLATKNEILKLRVQLKRTEEERDILKKAARYLCQGACLSMSTVLYGVS
ncbi:transposase IS3/IS911 family protein [Musicola paradisiaca Ech703]|uniref:Transposase IS3/IS911 family protein n=1 Tax=Musicola paradisiaca (strain Ech703) TaxID=579405 RepID=C6CB92_MUSP7|nr:transposase IS3/IS911 family protein [Musicola paradisiaca Ech703]